MYFLKTETFHFSPGEQRLGDIANGASTDLRMVFGEA
jgi:hypothetical protein